MFDRSKFMRVYGVDWQKWAARFDIEPVTAPCQDCAHELKTTLPFYAGTLRGLIAPTCPECGCKTTPYCVVSAWKDGSLFG